jgi:hypothetical protein
MVLQELQSKKRQISVILSLEEYKLKTDSCKLIADNNFVGPNIPSFSVPNPTFVVEKKEGQWPKNRKK